MKLQSINPSNYQMIDEINVSTEVEISAAVAGAKKAFTTWGLLSVEKRVSHLRRLLEVCKTGKNKLGQIITTEMGMPAKERDFIELDSGLEYFEWYLDNAAKSLQSEVSFEDDQMINTVSYEGYGVAAVIQPWNYPLSQFTWSAIPALLAGNTVVYKSSEEVPFSNKCIESFVKESNLPEGVLSFVYGDGKVGDYLVHQDIDLIAFTGSTKTGRHLYQVAAEKFIKINLEMGGSAPGIVFEDADISETIESVMMNRFGNCGQNCDGLKRLIVHKSRFDEVVEAISKELQSKIVGDPTNVNTDFGPLVAERQLDLLESQVNDAVENGAKAICGGKQPDGLVGAYFEPTLLTHVTKNMRVWKEEVFGPVLPIVSFETEEEAIALANDTEYGLGGFVLTKDLEKAARVARKMQTGMVAINSSFYLKPHSPFGGYKHSGLGREHGKYGFHDLSQIKVISTPK